MPYCRVIVPLLTGFLAWTTGCQTLLDLLPEDTSGQVTITAVRTGCSEMSRSVALTANAQDASLTFQWYFPDGTSLVGSNVIHTFDEPGSYNITLLAGGKVTRTRISVPLQGESDGAGDPFGDRCVPNEGDTHVPTNSDVTYLTNPPASGPHYSQAGLSPVDPGIYTNQIRAERWVHNLEHGQVVVLFDCSGDCPESLIQNFETLFDSVRLSKHGNKKLIVTRFEGLQVPIMAIAWDVQRDFQSFDLQGLIDFYDLRVDRGPEDEP
ncbi:MAG: DUF3105 domain-containing protein [Planctomycetota bacterium]